MSDGAPRPTVLVLGGTGRTGQRVLQELVRRGCMVRAIVRTVETLPTTIVQHPAVTVVVGSLLSLSQAELRRAVQSCDAVVSCLGHVISVKGILGPPHDLVTRAIQQVSAAIEANRPASPVRVILMSSVAVNHPAGSDTRRHVAERLLLAALRVVLPPARDNQRAADFLYRRLGVAHPFVQWVAVRPDTLEDGEVSAYTVHEQLVSSVFAPAETRMANVAHFMGELATSESTWGRWAGKFPVIIDSMADATPTADRARAG